MNDLERFVAILYARVGTNIEALDELMESAFGVKDQRLKDAIKLLETSFSEWKKREGRMN